EDFVAAAKYFLNGRLDAPSAAARRSTESSATAALSPAIMPAAIVSPSIVTTAAFVATTIWAATITSTAIVTPGFLALAADLLFRSHHGLVIADVDIGHAAVAHRLAGVKAALTKILRLDVADVQKAV